MTDAILHPQTKGQTDSYMHQPSHALGVFGADGAGKSYVAKRIATDLLGTTIESNPYVYILDAAESGGIEQVREIQSFLKLKVPGKAAIRRCILIEHTDWLRHEAQNALLKTLEEPPADTVIICTVSNKRALLTTISSRLQWINLLPLTHDQAKGALGERYELTKIDRAYYMSDGNVALMLSLLDETVDHPLVTAIDNAKGLLRASRYDRLRQVDLLAKAESVDSLHLVDALQRLLHAALISSSQRPAVKPAELSRIKQQIELVLDARELLETKVSTKLVLTRLFHSL